MLTSILPSRRVAAGDYQSFRADDPRFFLTSGADRGSMGMTGQAVSSSSAMSVSSVFACVRNLSEDVARLPLFLYRRLPGGGKEKATNEPLYWMLHNNPNTYMTSMIARQAIMVGATLWGNGYAIIMRSLNTGEAESYWPVEPWRVLMREREDGSPFFIVGFKGGQQREVEFRDMIHIVGMTEDGLMGRVLWRQAENAIGLAQAAMEFTSKFFANGASPSGMLLPKTRMKEDHLRQFEKDMNDRYAGAVNSHKIMAINFDADFKIIERDSQKAQRVETMRFAVEEILRFFRMPPHKAGDLSRATNNNIEHQSLEYVQDTVQPWTERTEQEFERKLIPENRQQELVIEHEFGALLRTDSKTRAEVHNLGIRGGWRNPNEARALENLNPYAGGDAFRVEQNLAVIDAEGMPMPVNAPAENQAPAPPSASLDAERIKAAMMPTFAAAITRLISRETLAIGGCKRVDDDWLTNFYAKHHGEIVNAMTPLCESLATLLGLPAGAVATRYADEHVAESRRTMADIGNWLTARPPESARRLTDRIHHES